MQFVLTENHRVPTETTRAQHSSPQMLVDAINTDGRRCLRLKPEDSIKPLPTTAHNWQDIYHLDGASLGDRCMYGYTETSTTGQGMSK